MTPAEMKAEHFSKFKSNAKIKFQGSEVIWIIGGIVKRGAVIFRADNGSHMHLEEWHKLALATVVE
jgi:hypothetical protein